MGFFGRKKDKKVANIDFPFFDAPNTACITCRHVMDKEKAITYISHDADDGMWQFLCEDEHSDEDARIVSLYEVYLIDKTIGQVADMPCGCCISKKNGDNNWK